MLKVNLMINLLLIYECDGMCLNMKCIYSKIDQSQCSEYKCGYTTPRRTEYDFIIVGGGTAGCVLANRLSENPNWNVLLLEAGVRENMFTDIPFVSETIRLTNFAWKYESEPQSDICLGLKGRKCHLVGGKALGGSSVINHMLYTRGLKSDFDEWESLGNKGWCYEDIKHYFKGMEHFKIPEVMKANTRGLSGPLTIENARYRSTLSNYILEAATELGLNTTSTNADCPVGLSYVEQMMKNGKRFSAAKAYITPVQGRRNLQISLLSNVEKVLIDPDTRRAYGVKFKTRYGTKMVFATKEVIISAGALSSPKILMLSGVGPKAHLEELNIPVIVDLPVGKKLMDHVVFPTMFVAGNKSSLKPLNIFDTKMFADYFTKSEGPLMSSGAEVWSFLKINDSAPGNSPDFEVLFVPTTFGAEQVSTYKMIVGFSDETADPYFRNVYGKVGAIAGVILLNPKSMGSVKLKSRDPLRHLSIQPGYYSNQEDVGVMVQSIRKVINIMEQPTMKKTFEMSVYNSKFPGCKQFEFNSDEYWACAIRQVTIPGFHFVATCKMGSENDPEAVVDSELRVKGIKNLRVADNSVAPTVTRGHTASLAFMIGEKAADMIKKSWS